MQSDWHRYNLKRRVATLPPLTSEVFAEKVLANKASQAATAARASFEKRCESCEKTYYSEGAYLNHLNSQKHRVLAARWNGKAGTETDSLVDSTFSLGEPLDAQSTTTESTINGVDEQAEEEFEEVVDTMRATRLEDASLQDPLSARPSRPTPSSQALADMREHPIPASPADDMEENHKSDPKQCLFCNYMSPTVDLNLNHMNKQHGFFIPEREYLVNLPGLLHYLSETIAVLHQCLYCHKTVYTTSGVQTHMRDRGHCMIAYSTEEEQLEVGDFYDFRSTYSDAEDEEEEEEASGGVSLGVKRKVKTTVENEDGEDVEMGEGGNEEDWESDSTLSSVPTDEITSVPIDLEHKQNKLGLHRHHSHTDPRPHKNTDGFHSHAHHTPVAVYHDEYELHLPSGRTAGHRSLNIYYRQNLRHYPTAEERAQQRLLTARQEDTSADADAEDNGSETTETQDRGRGRQLVLRANGGLGMVGVSDATKREVQVREKRELKRAARAENRYRAGNEKRNNFQKHFRDPLLQ